MWLKLISLRGDIPYPIHSLDLPVCDYFFWEDSWIFKFLNVDKLKNFIPHEIVAIPEEMTKWEIQDEVSGSVYNGWGKPFGWYHI